MPIDVQCKCGQRFQVSDSLAGRVVKCSKCNLALPIPAARAPQPAASSPRRPLYKQPRFVALVGGGSALLAVVVVLIVANHDAGDNVTGVTTSEQPANAEQDTPPPTGYEASYASEPTDSQLVETPAWEDNIFVWTLAISADGRHIAAYALERTPKMPQSVQLWDTATGKMVREFEQPNRPNRLRFTPNGTLVLGAGSILDESDREVTENRIWETSTGELVTTFPGSPKFEAAASEDNRIVFCFQDRAIAATDIETGETTWIRMQDDAQADVVAFDQSGRVGVAVAWDPTPLMQVFDLRSGQATGDAVQLDSYPYLMAIDHSAKWLATIDTAVDHDERRSLILWELNGAGRIEEVIEHELQRGTLVLGLAISPDGEYVAYEVEREEQSRQSYVGVWSRDRNEVRKIHGQAVYTAFSPAGELVVSFYTTSFRERGRKHVEFYNPENCQRIERLTPLRSID